MSGVLKDECQHERVQRVSVCRNTEVTGGCGGLEAARSSLWKVTDEVSWGRLWRTEELMLSPGGPSVSRPFVSPPSPNPPGNSC